MISYIIEFLSNLGQKKYYTKTIDKGNPSAERKIYFKDKKLTIIHRDGAPAIVWKNGNEEWYKDGMCHREDGPAVKIAGFNFYYLNNEIYTPYDYKAVISKKRFGNFV